VPLRVPDSAVSLGAGSELGRFSGDEEGSRKPPIHAALPRVGRVWAASGAVPMPTAADLEPPGQADPDARPEAPPHPPEAWDSDYLLHPW
jgi:hypothetical protein